MKYKMSSVTHATGLSKTGSSFSMCRATVLVPVELANSPKYQCVGAGETEMQFDVADNFIEPLLAKFTADYKGQPVVYDLDVMPRERGNAIVIGFVGFSSPASVQPQVTTKL